MNHTLGHENTEAIVERLGCANAAFSAAFPGDSSERQPVHTMYGGAHLFRRDSISRLGRRALETLERFAPHAAALAEAIGLPREPANLAQSVYDRVAAKLRYEPIEDYRIDFEDGYGYRPDAEEDAEAERSAIELGAALKAGDLAPFSGFRIKPLTETLKARSIRTLDIFLTTLLEQTAGALPAGFVVTLPKVTIPEQVSAMAEFLELFESKYRLAAGSLRLEIMIETPQALLNLPALIDASRGRCRGAHFGPYDYTSSLNITSTHQQLMHPACDFARHLMLVTLAQRGVTVSDGPTNIIPVGEAAAVHAAWRLHARNVRHALVNGFYQGWDLHPAQLPSRYAAVYAFFLEGLPAATVRLKNFIEKAAQASMVGDVFDDAATGQGLLNFFLRGVACGALTEAGLNATGLTAEELRTRSFLHIVEARRPPAR